MDNTENNEFYRAVEACFPLLGLNSLLEQEELKEISSGLKMVYSHDCNPTFAYFDSLTADDLFEIHDDFEDMSFAISPEIDLLMTKDQGAMKCIYKY